MDWRSLDQQYIVSTYKRLPIAIAKGEGNYLYDTNGKGYLDLFTGLAVNVLGHSHPRIIQALREQGEQFLHISNIFLNPPAIKLAQRLIEHTIPGKVFFTNSGAEATEAAIKLIHKWTAAEGTGRSGIVVLSNSFHGRTLGALRLTRQPNVYQDFPQPDFPVYELKAGDIDQLRAVCEERRPAAVLMEPVLGSGGVVPLAESYLQEVAAICQATGTLFAMDEIQTGMGRTGKLFAFQHAAVTPDLILFAKGVGGGLPLGGVIAGEKLQDLFKPGDHGTTFAPSPLSAALGNAVLDELLDAAFQSQLQDVTQYLWDRLEDLRAAFPEQLQSLRGKGMMVGIPLSVSPEEVSRLQQNLLEEGILVDVTQKTIVRLLPPLTLTRGDVDRFMEAFTREMSQLAAGKEA
ncbi:aspartate aminotransferase family protein [Brevibacillus borstelensis]|uniref:aspartate aminotransferase family protein n=1 Tax=Brevibacillus borstelensis TaxID=45462 RepID=UPI00046AAD24|nr:acetylornithine transaminase [Brevibacillus borstelensis]MCC0563218.1 acetylornithine transaminase [Brevibacillus borstelensis]MCM3471309.1 acetylornithine transaminase [Brevibacillus borstelensis]MCM3557640.1 acetylornithine transaminase [Brevibacillus borstelensis]MED1850208.1 acetylornithine transaminase [Brevibacillus borstelensis]WNF07624.1 acetylornithine transaminase [Brevibacillus borstelensis]